jgi:hypothetical protein
VKLLEVVSPNEKTSVNAGGSLQVSWQSEGIANGTDVRISILYEDETLVAQNSRMRSSSGVASVLMPSARFLQAYSTVRRGKNNRFQVRIDLQHEVVEFSSGWSNQIYARSPYFTVKM